MEPGSAPPTANSVWIQVRQVIVKFLDPNDVACIIRLLDRATATEFQGPEHTIVCLSRPCCPRAFHRRWAVPGAVRSLTLTKRRQLVCLVAASGSLDNLEVAARAAACTAHDDAIPAAAAVGQRISCVWLRYRGYPWGDAMATAARAGRQDMCEWLLRVGCPWSPEAVYAAGRGGHADLMEWLRPECARGRARAGCVVAAAAEGCELAALQRLYEKAEQQEPGWMRPGDWERILGGAAGSPTPDWRAKVEWLAAQRPPEEGGGGETRLWAAARAAARCPGADAQERLSWLRQRGYPITTTAVCEAARAGNADALRYLLGQDIGALEDLELRLTAREAAAGGHLAALQALHAHRDLTDGGFFVLVVAVEGAHLPVAVWAVEALGADVRRRPALLDRAARAGSVGLMALLQEHGGGPMTGYTLRSAVRSGCEEAVEWLLARGCLVEASEAKAAALEAAQNGDLVMLLCVRERLGWVPVTEDFLSFADGACSLEVLLWWVGQGLPVELPAVATWVERLEREPRLRLVRNEVSSWLRDEVEWWRQLERDEELRRGCGCKWSCCGVQ